MESERVNALKRPPIVASDLAPPAKRRKPSVPTEIKESNPSPSEPVHRIHINLNREQKEIKSEATPTTLPVADASISAPLDTNTASTQKTVYSRWNESGMKK